MKKLFLILICSLTLLSGSIFTENQTIDEIEVSAITIKDAKKKAMEEALIQALRNFEIEDGVLQQKILTQYKFDKYFLQTTENSIEKVSDGVSAIYSFEISGSKLYNDLNKVITKIMKEHLGKDKIMTAFLVKSDDNVFDRGDLKKVADANNKRVNASIKKAFKKLKIKTKDEAGLKEILNKVSKESVKLSTAEAQNKFEADVIRLAKKKKYKYVLVGVVNILDKKKISGNVGLNTDIIGKVIDLKNDDEEIVTLSKTRKIMGSDLKDAVLNLSDVIGEEIVATQMTSQLINSFANKDKVKRIELYVCKDEEFEDDFDDFQGIALDILDETGKQRDQDDSNKKYNKYVYDLDMEKLSQYNSKIKKIRHLKKYLFKSALKEDFEDAYVKSSGNRYSISLSKSVKCLPKKKKKNSKGKVVSATGYGKDVKMATNGALQSALEQVMGANIKSSTMVKEGNLESDDISSTTAGLVNSYKVKKIEKANGGYDVSISAVVNENAITESGIRDFINDKKSMQTFLSHNFKNRKLNVVYLEDKILKKIFGDSQSEYALPKKSIAANEIISTIRKNLQSKGFKFTNEKSKVDTNLYTYVTGEYKKSGSGYEVTLNLMLKAQDIKTKNILLDMTKEVQAYGDSKQQSISQASRKAADAVSLEFAYEIVNSFINN